MSRFLTVAIDSWKKQIKSLAFWIMVLMPVIMMLASTAVSYFSNDTKSQETYIVCDEKLGEYFKDIEGFKIANKNEAKEKMDDKKIGSFAEIAEESGILVAKYHTRNLDSNEIASFNLKLKEAQNSLNIENAQIRKDKLEILGRQASFNIVEDEGGQSFIMYGAYFALIFYMYLMLVMYSNVLVVEIATEKGSKMIEFIFSSIKAGTYFAGKILGNFLAIISQTLIYGILGGIGFYFVKSYGILDKLNIDIRAYLGGINILMLVEIGVLVILSLLIFMIVAAMLGSLAQKQEDAGKVATPMMLVIMFAFFTSMVFMGKDENLLVKVLSYLPFTSVFFMPLRMIKKSVGLGLGLISIIILIISIVGVYKISSKIYKKNILNYSSRSFIRRSFRKS